MRVSFHDGLLEVGRCRLSDSCLFLNVLKKIFPILIQICDITHSFNESVLSMILKNLFRIIYNEQFQMKIDSIKGMVLFKESVQDGMNIYR